MSNPPLTSVDIHPPLTSEDIARIPGPVTARFQGGHLDGQEMAMQDARPVIEFPVYNNPYVGPATQVPQQINLSTEVYRATARTITAEPVLDWCTTNMTGNTIYPLTSATNYSITIEYTAANTVTGTANGAWPDQNWNLQTNKWVVQGSPLYSFDPPTPEQQAAQARKWARTERRRVLAHKRARRLLLNLLSEQQQEEYAKSKTFTVVAKNGKVFRLRKGKTAELLGSDGVAVAAYCIHLPYGYNHEDTLVALLLSLQTDPAEFERIANITRLQRPVQSMQDLAVGARSAAVAMQDAGQAARYAAEHVRETRAALRSEGLSEAEVEALRDPPNHRSGILVAAA